MNWSTFQSHNLPEDIFTNSETVTVIENDDQIYFKALNTKKSIEVIFLQGGLTDPKAYAPLCRNIAEAGYSCHLLKMDFRLPQYDYQKTKSLLNLETGNYVIGGHSQGGKMAAQLVYENPNNLKGLFLLGTSHPRDIDLSNLSIPCIKLYAENDGLASVGEVMENKNKLPKNTKLKEIKGGNHSQFGYLGQLFMDDSPNISLIKQQNDVYVQLITFFDSI